MGLEEIASSTGANIPRSKFMKSTQANDHSNPQQGTGAKKAIMQDNDRQNKKNSSPVTSRTNASHASGHVEDKRKLFVGGLPTDSKFHMIEIFGRRNVPCYLYFYDPPSTIWRQ